MIRQETLQPVSGPWFWLIRFQISPSEIVYITTNNESVEFDGNTYHPFPVSIGDITEYGDGSLPEVMVEVQDPERLLGPMLYDNIGFTDAPVELLKVHADHLTPEDVAEGYRYVVQATEPASETSYRFRLAEKPLLRTQSPRERILPGKCRFSYGGAQCGYDLTRTGALPTCDLTLNGANGCVAHGDDEDAAGLTRRHPRRFGGFPTVPIQ